jgi:hypothetical protein
VLPAVIYLFGTTLLGPYGDAKGIGTLYGDFFRDLAEPSGRTWALALGPLAIVTLMRAVFLGVRTPPAAADDAPHRPSTRTSTEHVRVEPSVGLDGVRVRPEPRVLISGTFCVIAFTEGAMDTVSTASHLSCHKYQDPFWSRLAFGKADYVVRQMVRRPQRGSGRGRAGALCAPRFDASSTSCAPASSSRKGVESPCVAERIRSVQQRII